MPPTLNIAGKKFVVIPADEYRQLKAKAAQKSKAARTRGQPSRQERGDIAESRRRLNNRVRVPADEVFNKLGI